MKYFKTEYTGDELCTIISHYTSLMIDDIMVGMNVKDYRSLFLFCSHINHECSGLTTLGYQVIL
jgi:hypothetical protein